MVDRTGSGSALDALADTIGERTIEAFEVLANETRLAILLALWEAEEPTPPITEPSEAVLSFSELYDRIDIQDSGNFTYHLDRLADGFVEEVDTGYRLSTPAQEILRAVFAGTLAEPRSFEDEPIDAECFRCGAPVLIDYRERTFIRRCTDCEGVWQNPDGPPGTLVWAYRPPVAVENRTVQEFNRDGNTRDRHRRASMMEGVCPDCAGTISTTVHVCDDHEAGGETLCAGCGSLWEIQTLFVCDVCKFAWITPAWGPIFTETAVRAFFYERGLDPKSLFDVAFYSAANRPIFDAIDSVALTGEDPPELSVAVAIDGDRLEVTLDADADVVDVTEVPG